MSELQDFLESKPLPGKLVFAKVWGSRSHNCHLPESDWDFSGVYVVPTNKVLGIQSYQESFVNEDKPDYAFYEAGKFCRLLLIGNPALLEMLFTENMYTETPDWINLKRHRQTFLSKTSVSQYVGYADGQLRRLKAHDGKKGLHTSGGAFNGKWAYHLIRLLIDAERIVYGDPPLVWKDGEERDHLMNIRHNNVSCDEIEKEAEERIIRIRSLLESSRIPEIGNEEVLNKWLISLRMKQI